MNKNPFSAISIKHIIIISVLSILIATVNFFTTSKKSNSIKYTIILGYENIPFDVVKENIETNFSKDKDIILSVIDSVNTELVKIRLLAGKQDSSKIRHTLNKISNPESGFIKQYADFTGKKARLKLLTIQHSQTNFNEKGLDTISVFIISFLSGMLLLIIFKK